MESSEDEDNNPASPSHSTCEDVQTLMDNERNLENEERIANPTQSSTVEEYYLSSPEMRQTQESEESVMHGTQPGSRTLPEELDYSQSNAELMEDSIQKNRAINDETCPDYLRKGFENVPESLRNIASVATDKVSPHLFDPSDIVEDEFNLLTLKPMYEKTMDSAGKCFQVIPANDWSHYMQPYEGYPLCYVDRCNSMNIPHHISDVLYFYYSMLNHIKSTGLTNYAVPVDQDNSQLLKLKRVRNDPKKIMGIHEVVIGENMGFCTSGQESSQDFDYTCIKDSLSRLFSEHDKVSSDHLIERDPFSIRVAYTGAFFKVGGEPTTFGDEQTTLGNAKKKSSAEVKQELFCVAIVTPVRAFDFISYVRDFLSSPPKNVQQRDHWCQLDLCYRRIHMFEVNNNCGLQCDPGDYKDDISGKGGVLSVLSMLRLPMRIAWVIQNMGFEESPYDIEIIGFPRLSFKYDGKMEGYCTFMNTYINNQVEVYDTFQKNIQVYYSSSEVMQNDCPQQNMKSPGGWPLPSDDCFLLKSIPGIGSERDVEYFEFQRFGLFKFPLVMRFKYQKFIDKPNRESFVLNLGQEPESVLKKKNDFKTFDYVAGMRSIMPDATILQSNEEATPLQVLNKYYGPNAKPAEDFKDSRLIKWYEAMRVHVQSQRVRYVDCISPDDAMVQVRRHVDSCMEQHTCIVRSDGYGSMHFQQCMKVVDNLSKTCLAGDYISSNLRSARSTHAPVGIRHDTYLSTSYAMLHEWVKFNVYACLYSTNSEAALEIMLSSLLWHLGSHSHTMTSFFQGCLIVGGLGHLQVVIDKVPYVDWRKINSSGAGAIQDRLNKMKEELGRVNKIMKDDNKLIYINPNRNTMAALENECCVITVNTGMSEVKSKPSPAMKDMPLLMLENRGDYSLDTLIRFVFPRDGVQRNVALTTMDLDKTNDRSVALKEQICNPNVCGFCTNQKKGTDEPKSLICVTHVCHPGAPAYFELKESSCQINDVQCELNDGRAKMPQGEDMKSILKTIFFSKVFTSVMVALPHRSGMMPFHINSTTSALLDWMYMIVRSHLFCIFNGDVIENFGRIKVLFCFAALF